MKNNRMIRVLVRHMASSSKQGEGAASASGRFAGRSVIVTGGAKGIGEGCVRVFHREGARVAILDKDGASGQLLAQQLNKSDSASTGSASAATPRVIALQCDVTQENQLQQAIDTAVSGWGGRLDCLVNNAGWHPPPVNLEDISTQQYLHHMDINLTSTFWGCKFALPYLRNSLASQAVQLEQETQQLQQHQQQQQQQQALQPAGLGLGLGLAPLPIASLSSSSSSLSSSSLFASSSSSLTTSASSSTSSASSPARSLFASTFGSYPGLSARKFGRFNSPVSFSGSSSASAWSSSSSLSSSSASSSSTSSAQYASFSTLAPAPAASAVAPLRAAPAPAPAAPMPVPVAAQSVWTASKHHRNVSIVNVSSLVGVQGQSQAVSYAAAKAGQIAITKSLAKDLGAEGIRVNCVCPSNVLTPLMTEWASSFQDGNTSAALKLVADKQVLGRLASIEEIGNVVLFLASDDASFITGQALVVDGGATLG